MGDLAKLRELVFSGNNTACFIERERILQKLEADMQEYTQADKYAIALSRLLDEVSTPIEDCDYFAGRVVEALPDEGMEAPNLFLASTGHMNMDYRKLLSCGLHGIFAEIEKKAAEKNDEESEIFTRNAEIVILAIRRFTDRYAMEARKKGRIEMATALERVPFEPAYDFYSALQSVWMIHMIASCYVGSRDYGFGRFDEYMLPYYESAIKNGQTDAELTELLAGFFMKTNEICGRTVHNYKQKPVPCHSSKQYVNIGGEEPNDFSNVVLRAAEKNNMAQPQITVLLKPAANRAFTEQVFRSMSVLVDKLHIYNYGLIVNCLLNKGIKAEIAREFTYSACCTFDLNYHSIRMEQYPPIPQIFCNVLQNGTYQSIDEILKEFEKSMWETMQKNIDAEERRLADFNAARKLFVLDGILLTDSAAECRYALQENAPYTVYNIFCPGIATIGDSLMALDRLVFQTNRFSYHEFMRIVHSDYSGQEVLRQEILHMVKFGNDTPADQYTVRASEAFLNAVDDLNLKENRYAIGGLYSLERDNVWKAEVPATPDGRKSGEPFSENQSPTYGADKNGITALLKSLSKLPFGRTATGGLNLTFSHTVLPETLEALITSYFELGGLHVGMTVADREVLLDAMKNPAQYQTLTVRLYGFSEYFISLSKWQQLAILNRTAY